MKKNMTKTESIRRKNTLDFLRAQAIRKCLSGAEDLQDVGYVPSENRAAEHVRPFHPFPMVGQVRVLKDTERLVYVLLAKEWDESSFLVIPFSSYSQPATELELAVKNQGGLGLRVLQIWNARSLCAETLKKGWRVGQLPLEDINDALSLWNYYTGGEVPSEDIIARTGLPIFRSDDPRLKYQEESIADFVKVDAADLAVVEREEDEKRKTILFVPTPTFTKSRIFDYNDEYALAAADAEKDVAAECSIEGFDGVVRVMYVPSEQMLYLRVLGKEGDVSSALDGWGVLGSSAEVLGYLRDGGLKVEVDKEFDGSLTLLDKSSNPHPLCNKDLE